MTNLATIKLYRTSQAVSSGRAYEIYIDHELWGEIEDGETKSIELPPGKYDFCVKIDWLKSKTMTLDLEPGTEEALICGSRLVGMKQWLSIFYLFSKDQFVYLDRYVEGTDVLNHREETWQTIKAKGFMYYILRHGVLGWGVPVGLFVALATVVGRVIGGDSLTGTDVFNIMFVNILVFAIGGAIFGTIMWWYFRRLSAKNED